MDRSLAGLMERTTRAVQTIEKARRFNRTSGDFDFDLIQFPAVYMTNGRNRENVVG